MRDCLVANAPRNDIAKTFSVIAIEAMQAQGFTNSS